MRQIIITAKIMEMIQQIPLREHHEFSLLEELFITLIPCFCPEVMLKNWSVLDKVGDGEDSSSDTVLLSLTPFKNCFPSGDNDRDASLSLILARSLSTFFNIRFTFLACLLLEFLSLASCTWIFSTSSWSWISSPTPISEEEADTLNGLLVGSDKYKSCPGTLPELLTNQPSPLRTSPPNRPSVPIEAYIENKYYGK